MPTMTEITCRFCGKARTVLKKSAHRYSTCGAPECVSQRRHEGAVKPKGAGSKNPNYSTGQWVRTEKLCLVCGAAFTGPARRKFCSPTCATTQKAIDQKGKPFPTTKRSKAPKSEGWKDAASILFSGARNPNWKGGVTPANAAGRTTWSYRKWRKQVFDRDKHQCRRCGTPDGIIAHHLDSYADVPQRRLELSNGLTLCGSCHKRYHLGLVSLTLQVAFI